MEGAAVFEKRLSPPVVGDRLVVVLYDQLNLAMWPAEVLAEATLVFVESLAYATFLPHHPLKLTYILSAQRHFALDCAKAGYRVLNWRTTGTHADGAAEVLQAYPGTHLTYMEPSEWEPRHQLRALRSPDPTRLTEIPNAFFLTPKAEFTSKIRRGYRLETFYREMRKRTGYLMAHGKPVGDRWNFDQENRQKLPKGVKVPPVPTFPMDEITQEVWALVQGALPHPYGQDIAPFALAVTRTQALALLADFVAQRLDSFGPYEDAMRTGEPFLFHSVLSIYLNNGLLLPQEVCEQAIAAYDAGQARLNSVEGLVRQVLGWREFIRIYYEAQMPAVREANHFGFTEALPTAFWDGEIELACVRDALHQVHTRAYSHHIQRLMILSNFSNLTQTDPRALNQWFYAAYADAYEWVELPNVLGMATYADGGILASKPYIAGGNYVRKMSDACDRCAYDVKQKTGDRACPLNYLYWDFVAQHRADFLENGRVSLALITYDKKTEVEKQAIADSATRFRQQLRRTG
ncbi:MAG TPA: cryptochrome/photolyase family protein [Cyanobacteria bacterium UBA8156]|jgi:deoxyribodipyrimidine photolyase-related protein|nr:cryptochrome/photolyase family protein [Cyanobacteria bacterium UBA8156]